jgi:hypothetical protein
VISRLSAFRSLAAFVPESVPINPEKVAGLLTQKVEAAENGMCVAFHPENKIVMFGFNGVLKFPGPSKGKIEITSMALAGNKCASKSISHWDGDGHSNTLTQEIVSWHFALAASLTFEFEKKDFSAEFGFQGKIFIDLDRQKDNSLIGPADVLDLLIRPLDKSKENKDKGDFSVLIQGTPSASFKLDVGRNRTWVFDANKFAQAQAHVLLTSESLRSPIKFSGHFEVSFIDTYYVDGVFEVGTRTYFKIHPATQIWMPWYACSLNREGIKSCNFRY